MGNQNSNDARSPMHETSSKGESETWEDVIVHIKVEGLSRSNSMVNPPTMDQERRIISPRSSKAESKESESWEDVVSSIRMEVSKSFSRSSSVKDIPIISEKEATSSTKPVGDDDSLMENDERKDGDDESEALEVSSIPSLETTNDLNEKYSTPKGPPDTSKDLTAQTDPSPEPTKESHFNTTSSDDSSTASEKSSQRAGLLGKTCSEEDSNKNVDDTDLTKTDAEPGKEKENEQRHMMKMSPLQSFLSVENIISGDDPEDGSRSPLINKEVQKSKSLTERFMLGGRRKKSRSNSFSIFSCGFCGQKENLTS